jgi:bifunctional non-homologous end joining protein LigD
MHARIHGRDIKLLTRTGLDWSHRYRRTIEALGSLKVKSAYLDGELCALDGYGVPVFSRLQAAMDEGHTDQLVFFAFDLLFLNGDSTAELPLINARSGYSACSRKRFMDCATAGTLLVTAPAFASTPVWIGRRYLQASRSTLCARRPRDLGEVQVPEPRGVRGRRLERARGKPIAFRALLLGYYTEHGRLHYAGRAGTGITDKELKRPAVVLKPVHVSKMPLTAPPPRDSRFGSPLKLSRVHWVRPELVVEVTYLTWTEENPLRQVSYQSLREDKPARQVVRSIHRRTR